MKILIVDDHSDFLDSLRLLLELEGHQIIAVSNAAFALQQLSNGHAFDLVITDYQMPGICGDEFFRQARRQMGALTPPFILHSAHHDELTNSEAALPWHDCVPKGNPELLRRCLQRFCSATPDSVN